MKSTRLLMLVSLSVGTVWAAQPAQKIHWASYKSNLLHLQFSVPQEWKPTKTPKALAFRYEDADGSSAGVGILKSEMSGSSIDDAANKEIAQAGNPGDWVRTDARVDGNHAIKIVGPDVKNSMRKIVHYYIDTPQGIYLVQCQATADHWDVYSPIFTAILTKLKFLPQ